MEETQQEVKALWAQLLNPADGGTRKCDSVCALPCLAPYIGLRDTLASTYLLPPNLTSPS